MHFNGSNLSAVLCYLLLEQLVPGRVNLTNRKCGLAWSVLLLITIRVITVVSPQQILTTMMTGIVVDKSTDNAKPH